jgi:hypothetical protein
VEVKAWASKLASLLSAIEGHGQRVDLFAPDRGLDALRKAKYLVRHRPPSLRLVGGEERWHFAVAYPSVESFVLTRRNDPLEDLGAG